MIGLKTRQLSLVFFGISMGKQKTHVQFIEEMKSINSNIEFLSTYENVKKKIKCKCTICNNEWDALPTNLLKGHGCRKCAIEQRIQNGGRKTHQQFIEEMESINPNIEFLSDYINSHIHVKCKCKIDGYEWETTPSHLLNGTGCPLCAKNRIAKSHKMKTHDEYINECKIANPNIEIVGFYTGALNDVECKCLICGGHFTRRASKNHEGCGCPICAGLKIVQGINDIATIRPDLVKYFVDKNDAYKYGCGSNQKVMMKCPDCGTEKFVQISKLSSSGFVCQKCNDGISYPNKFARYLLEQLPVKNIIYEYIPEWIKEINLTYRYDNYFEYNGQKYILEMDGGFHQTRYYKSNMPLEETKRRDALKDELALKNNVNIIRIDCNISSKKYITNSILASELAKIFDLSIVDFDYCDRQALSSMVKVVCDYYNIAENKSTTDIAKYFNMSSSTISKYLHKGNELGFCIFHSPKFVIINVYNENQESMTFHNFSDCKRYVSKLLNEKITGKQIKKFIVEQIQYKGYTFTYGNQPPN